MKFSLHQYTKKKKRNRSERTIQTFIPYISRRKNNRVRHSTDQLAKKYHIQRTTTYPSAHVVWTTVKLCITWHQDSHELVHVGTCFPMA
jgi:hypothetical protein